ncbi:MAG: Ppx/GppA family phosphatase [Propionibacteriaceae bacterium]|jgi:exopolyphosphatase/guanosine-5'-triphosphate,3'-diphosphate pyrophosphatase|nr:Ppx/GppA family phosphatase [Propionibacteriaceae bacterium]
MRVAVIDCGTNTIRLLVADGREDGSISDVIRTLRFVRLGQGVDATGRFHSDALKRTFAAVEEYAALIAETKPERIRFLATSAARDVSNRDEFIAGVRERLGIDPEVISGDEEARLSFRGALAGGPVGEGPVLVCDIGGGSTELIKGDVSGVVTADISLNMGSVRLRERFLHTDPPTAGEIAEARAFVADLLDGSGLLLTAEATGGDIGTWIGVAGTSTSISAMVRGLTSYDPTIVHNSTVDVETIEELSQQLLSMTVAQTLARYPVLKPQRAEVICAGVLIAAEIAARVGKPMLVRETDILDGAAVGLLAES